MLFILLMFLVSLKHFVQLQPQTNFLCIYNDNVNDTAFLYGQFENRLHLSSQDNISKITKLTVFKAKLTDATIDDFIQLIYGCVYGIVLTSMSRIDLPFCLYLKNFPLNNNKVNFLSYIKVIKEQKLLDKALFKDNTYVYNENENKGGILENINNLNFTKTHEIQINEFSDILSKKLPEVILDLRKQTKITTLDTTNVLSELKNFYDEFQKEVDKVFEFTLKEFLNTNFDYFGVNLEDYYDYRFPKLTLKKRKAIIYEENDIKKHIKKVESYKNMNNKININNIDIVHNNDSLETDSVKIKYDESSFIEETIYNEVTFEYTTDCIFFTDDFVKKFGYINVNLKELLESCNNSQAYTNN